MKRKGGQAPGTWEMHIAKTNNRSQENAAKSKKRRKNNFKQKGQSLPTTILAIFFFLRFSVCRFSHSFYLIGYIKPFQCPDIHTHLSDSCSFVIMLNIAINSCNTNRIRCASSTDLCQRKHSFLCGMVCNTVPYHSVQAVHWYTLVYHMSVCSV